MRLPLKTKFGALVLGLVLTMMFCIWMLSIHEQRQIENAVTEQQRTTMRGELAKRAASIFSILSANGEALAIGDYLTVDAFVREIVAGSKDIKFIHIVKKGELVIPIAESGRSAAYQRPAWIKPAGTETKFDLVETPEKERVLVASGPIFDKSINLKVADAYVVISRNSIQESIAGAQEHIRQIAKNARFNMTFATLLFALLGVVSAILLVAFVLKPIHTLAEGAKRIGEGDLNHEVQVKSNDEVGDLAHMFNVMTRNLKDDRIQLIEKEKLEQELNIAMQIQHTLLPKVLPAARGFDFGAVYTSAREVGGDYYDFIPVGANGHSGIAVVVADVSGKGVPGAVMMAVTRSVLRAKAAAITSPADVLKSTNSILMPDMKKGMFVSMFYGVLDTASGGMEFSGAGHNPTLIYHAGTKQVESIRMRGLALGLGHIDLFNRILESRRVQLEPGDVLFQYTDGIQHAMNERDERFGMDRLTETIREFSGLDAQSIVDKVLERVITFTASAPQFDDITMVAVKRVRTP